MIQIFSAFGSKLHQLYDFASYCFPERGAELKEARRLTKFGMNAPSLFPQSTREDIGSDDFEPFIAHILGIYYSSIGHHDAIQTLTMSGHSLDSFILLRTQLEAILAFFYVTEPQDNLLEIFKRTERYRDWIAVKMKQNMDKSLKFDLLHKLMNGDFKNNVLGNYNVILEKYATAPQELNKLENANSFLSRNEREALAIKFHIEGFYHHIYAESSAGIHFADISDRMQEVEFYTYRYKIRKQHDAFWPLILSNMLQVKCILQFGKFFGVESSITPLVQDIMGFKRN
jgi:hypothetical protein